MAKQKVEFTRAIDETVTIVATGTNGIVRAQWNDEDNIQFFQVRYADSIGSMHSQWFREKELT